MSRRKKPDLIGELFHWVRANQAATDKMDDAAAESLGVNRTDSRVLDLIQQRVRVGAGELARETALTTGTVTAVIDRMEKKGYLRRVADPADRRRVTVEMTDLAYERADPLYQPLAERALPMLDRFTAAEIETIIAFLRSSTEIVEGRAAEIRAEFGAEET
jgi:DNA-binding MarR family transcriptional regulator